MGRLKAEGKLVSVTHKTPVRYVHQQQRSAAGGELALALAEN